MAETNNQWQYFQFSYINVLTYLLSCTVCLRNGKNRYTSCV